MSKGRQRQCTVHKAKPPLCPNGANVLFTKPSLHSVQKAPTTMYYSQSQASIVSKKRQRQCTIHKAKPTLCPKSANDNVLFTKDDRNAALKQFIDVFLLFSFIAPRQAYIKLCIHNLKSRRKDTSNQISFISPFVIELSVCSFKKVLQLTICICSVLSGSYTVFLKCLVF